MFMRDTMELTKKYAACPECGNDKMGGEPSQGALIIDDEVFTRKCKCGWSVTVDRRIKHVATMTKRRSLFEVIEEKQKQYYKLQNELRELITGADNVDVNYKGKMGIMIRIYTDSTADILLESDEGDSYEQHVNLSDLY